MRHATMTLAALLYGSLASIAAGGEPGEVNTRLASWARGLSVDSLDQADMKMYLWFYEWNMFDAVARGQHTRGSWDNKSIEVSEDGRRGTVESRTPGLRLQMRAVRDGAELTLEVTNRSEHDWPRLASIIACFNPGPEQQRNRQLANTRTYFHGPEGLAPLAMKAPREIHYNASLRQAIDREADGEGRYAWSEKWPKSDVDATGGLIVRESTDGRWVTGIAWERFLSAQGHNPWECMHLSVHVGPLKRGATRTVRGKIYLLKGKKEDVLKLYRADFEAE